MSKRMMVGRKSWICATLLPLLSLGIGCGSGGSDGNTPKITFVVPDLTAPYWSAGVKGAKAAAAAQEVDLTVTGTPTFSVSQYNAQVQAAITQAPDGLIVGPEDPKASNGVIDEAVKDGVSVATAVVDAPESSRGFFIGPNAQKLGSGQARRALSVLHETGAEGEVEAAITSCAPTALSQVQERQAFTKTVEEQNPYEKDFQVRVVTFLNATSDASQNSAVYDNLATAHPDVKVVFPMCVIDAQSAGETAKRRGTDWIVAADGWTPKILDLAEQGYVTFVVNEAPYETLEKIVTVMSDGIKGNAPTPTGDQGFPLDVAVKTPGEWPMPGADDVVSIEEARKSPDAVG